ncbi:hypothetical protein [Hydrogenophaga luteola]
MRRLITVIALSTSVLLSQVACATPPNADPDGELKAMRKVPALAWLDANKNPYALASNRFGSTANAREFVKELHRLGAAQVFVADPRDDEHTVKQEGGPYADTLIVSLPKEKSARAALFRVFAVEAKREGFSVERDVGQGLVLLWWD